MWIAGNFFRRSDGIDWIESGKHDGAAGGFALEAFEFGAYIGGVLIAEVAIFFEGSVDDAFEFGREFAVEANWAARRSVENAVEYAPLVSPLKGKRPVAIS